MRDTTKADLKAANEEVRAVMGRNAALKKEAAESYQKGYRDALTVSANLSKIIQTQAELISYYIGMIHGSSKL